MAGARRIRGYTDRPSVAQGEVVQFLVSNVDGEDPISRSVRVVKQGVVETEVASWTTQIPAQPVPAEGWKSNRWRVTDAWRVPAHCTPGVYVARIGDGQDDTRGIYFVVRCADGAPRAPLLVQLPTTTMNAYNNWGGRSLYDYNSGGVAAGAVSFDRPLQSDAAWPRGYGFEDEWELRIKAFVQWLELAGVRADFATSADLHRRPLRQEQLFVSVGHDEYWSCEMRDHFDAFVAAGGNAAILGGNTCYWQIRFEPDELGGAPDRREVRAVKWRDAGRAENASFGAGGGAYAWQGPGTPGAFEVVQPDHWIFEGTQLRAGDAFGGAPDESVVRYETNGVSAGRRNDGTWVPDGKDGTPGEYRILAFADLPDWGTPGNAALGVLERARGGIVFNAATTDWARGFEACLEAKDPLRTITGRITHNVIARLLKPSASGLRR